MTLLVEAPTAYEPERRYILDVVLRDWLGLDWQLRVDNRSDVRISLAEAPEAPGVVLPDVLFDTPREQWLTEASLPTVRVGRRAPVLYGAPGGNAGGLEVDVFGSAFFMLTRYEELAVPVRDEHERFPTGVSVAERAGLTQTPIVDLYVELLWAALERRWPRLKRAPRTYRVILSHDVDDPLATLAHGPRDVVRQLGGDVVRRRDPRLAMRRAGSLFGKPDLDPNNTFEFLMGVSERHGLTSAFYFLAHRDRGPHRGAFLFEHKWVRSLIGRLHRRGHEIGLHPSYSTYRSPKRIRLELERLLAVAADESVHQDEWGGRQHFLRWANPDTWRSWDEVGLNYDTTLGYSDTIGFRSGTCHAHRVFDLRQRQPLRLVERPFQVMDVALESTISRSPESAYAAVMEIAAQCRRYRGSLGILWHNNTLLRSVREQRWYAALIEAACAPPTTGP